MLSRGLQKRLAWRGWRAQTLNVEQCCHLAQDAGGLRGFVRLSPFLVIDNPFCFPCPFMYYLQMQPYFATWR